MLTKTGFSMPLHPYQVLTWVIFCWHSIIPPILIIPSESLGEKIYFLLLFYTTHAIVLVSGFKATKSNPSISMTPQPLYLETAENLNYFCTICKSYVTKTSKHCGSCDRCVNNFDHHCKWLNNCIGDVNYKIFIVLIMSLEVNEIILIISEIIAITTLSQQLPITLLVLDSVINGLVILLVGYLIGIHVVLKCKGMTTYEYIKSSRKKKENKVKHMETDTAKIKDSKLVNDEIKKSIIKSNNQSVLIKPYSFSIAKSLSEEEIAHLTFHVRTDQDKSLDNK